MRTAFSIFLLVLNLLAAKGMFDILSRGEGDFVINLFFFLNVGAAALIIVTLPNMIKLDRRG